MEIDLSDSKTKRALDTLKRKKTLNPIKYFNSLNDLSKIKEDVKKEREIAELKKQDLNVVKNITKKTLKNINKNCAKPEVFELTKYLFEEIDRELDFSVAKDSLKYIKIIEHNICEKVDDIKKSFKEFIKKSYSDRKEHLIRMKLKSTSQTA